VIYSLYELSKLYVQKLNLQVSFGIHNVKLLGYIIIPHLPIQLKAQDVNVSYLLVNNGASNQSTCIVQLTLNLLQGLVVHIQTLPLSSITTLLLSCIIFQVVQSYLTIQLSVAEAGHTT